MTTRTAKTAAEEIYPCRDLSAEQILDIAYKLVRGVARGGEFDLTVRFELARLEAAALIERLRKRAAT